MTAGWARLGVTLTSLSDGELATLVACLADAHELAARELLRRRREREQRDAESEPPVSALRAHARELARAPEHGWGPGMSFLALSDDDD